MTGSFQCNNARENELLKCQRGLKRTSEVDYSQGTDIKNFVSSGNEDVEQIMIERTHAHETAHVVKLDHVPLSDDDIMSEPMKRGFELGDGLWEDFDQSFSEFRVKE